MERSPVLQHIVDNLACELFGQSLSESQDNQVCVRCHNPVGELNDDISMREYEISGLCQTCQDQIFGV